MQMSFAPPLFVALIERLAAAHNARVERRMSVVVTGLADTVRRARAAIGAAGDAATRLESSANAVVQTIGTVNDMTAQLDAANRDLTDAVSVMTNGGPPLDSIGASVTNSPFAVSADPVTGVAQSLAQVQNANSASAAGIPEAPPATPYVAPPVVTASTIAAANRANAEALLNGTAVSGAPGSV